MLKLCPLSLKAAQGAVKAFGGEWGFTGRKFAIGLVGPEAGDLVGVVVAEIEGSALRLQVLGDVGQGLLVRAALVAGGALGYEEAFVDGRRYKLDPPG